MNQLFIFLVLQTTCFFYKHDVYKDIEANVW